MDLPANILIHNAQLGLKGGKGELIRVAEDGGFYEVKIVFGENTHRVLLPTANTVIIFRDPEVDFPAGVEIER